MTVTVDVLVHDDGCGCGYCRLRAGARRGGASAGAARRERRRRYLDGTMTASESREYARVLERCRKAGRAGGVAAGRAAKATKALALDLGEGFHDPTEDCGWRPRLSSTEDVQDVDDTTPAVLGVGRTDAV